MVAGHFQQNIPHALRVAPVGDAEGTLKRTRRSFAVQLVTRLLMNSEFGMMITTLSLVRTQVLRDPIRTTSPLVPPTSTRSPPGWAVR